MDAQIGVRVGESRVPLDELLEFFHGLLFLLQAKQLLNQPEMIHWITIVESECLLVPSQCLCEIVLGFAAVGRGDRLLVLF